MASFQVTCHAPDDLDAERRIKGLGGHGWWFTTDAIIQMIETGQHEFWASIGQQRHEVTVSRRGVTGRKYLTTAEGGFPPKGLLSLPVCPLAEGAGQTSDKSRWAPVQ